MRPTLIVRKLMQLSDNVNRIYTNKYENCRTVKCYGIDNDLNSDIAKVLNHLNIPHTIKTAKSQGTYHTHPVTIVRLPIDY